MENQKRLVLLASIISVALISSVIWIQGLPIGSKDLQIDDSGWRFIVDGYVQNSLNLTLNRIRTMPKTTLYAELICVGSPAFITEKGNWTGVKLGYILDEARILPQSIKVLFHAADGYKTDLDIEASHREDIIIAYEKDGRALPEQLRLVVPGKWGYKWIREITHIELVDYDALGSWESSGYSDSANIAEEQGNTGLPIGIFP